MPRKTREISGTGIYHVMMRGTNKQVTGGQARCEVFPFQYRPRWDYSWRGFFFFIRSQGYLFPLCLSITLPYSTITFPYSTITLPYSTILQEYFELLQEYF